MSRCEDCIHSEVCAELENYRDPLWFTNTKDEFCCSSYLPTDVAPRAEVIAEYRKKVYAKMGKYTIMGREYIQRIMREVEKEYTEGQK